MENKNNQNQDPDYMEHQDPELNADQLLGQFGAQQGQPTSHPSTPPSPSPIISPLLSRENPKQKKAKSSVFLIIANLVAICFSLGVFWFAGNWLFSDKSADKDNLVSSVIVPSSWEKIDTGLGFSVKAPAKWQVGSSASTNIDGQSSDCAVLSESLKITVSFDSSTSTDQTNTAPVSLSVCRQTLAGADTKEKFENQISDINSPSNGVYKAFGINPEKIKLTKSHETLNGKEFLKLNVNIPNQLSTTYYYWDKDHMISLSAVEPSNNQPQLDKIVKNYLRPITSTTELN